MEKIIEDIRRYVHAQWTLGALHGVRHWDRVYENGQKLLTSDVNPLVVGLFAYLHDSCRMDDGMDLCHGERAAVWIDTLRNTYLKDVSDEEIGLLKEAFKVKATEGVDVLLEEFLCRNLEVIDILRIFAIYY